MKTLFIYSRIYDFVAEEFIKNMIDSKGEDITIRANSLGGSVFAGWGMIDAIQSHEGNVKMQVDGVAASMMVYALLFCDDVICLDTSRFMFHKADGYAETDEDKQLLNSVNSQLRQKMHERFDSVKFEEVTGKTIDYLFDSEGQVDLWISAKQAKEIGLVSEVKRLSTSEKTAFSKLVASGKFEGEMVTTEAGEAFSEWNFTELSKHLKI